MIAEVAAALEPAVRGGLVGAGNHGYEFLHDRVQEAAYSLIPEADRAWQHLRIARLLEGRGTPAESDLIFQIVDHFKRAGALLQDEAERLRVAALKLSAAQRARARAAYGVALSWLADAAELLPPDIWQRNYGLKFEIELRRAECLLLTADQQAEARLLALSERAQGPIDSATVTCLRAGFYIAANQFELAISVCAALPDCRRPRDRDPGE